MPVRFAIASGNYSNPAIWDNGAIPLSDDIVYANGNTVELDQDIVVGTLQNGVSPIRVPNIATPAMTGSNSPSGVASASSTNGNAFPWFAFDQAANTQWISTASTGQLQYEFPTSKIIRRYSILASSNTALSPRNWTFEGSNDGISWNVLHTVTLGTGIPANTWYDSGVFSNSTPYTLYRLNITLSGGGLLYVLEVQMTESTSTAIGVNTGGSFTVSNNRIITCTNPIGMLNGNATPLLTVSSSLTITINSNLRGGLGNALRVTGLNHNITINGNVNGSSISNNAPAISRQASGQLTVIGDIYGGASGSHGILLNDTGTINILGNLYGTDVNGNNTAGVWIALAGLLNVTGSVNGGLFNNQQNYGIHSTVASTINVIGNVQGSAASILNYGIHLTGAATVNIFGNVIAGTGSGTSNFAINSTVASTINITGNVVATTACNAISSTSITSNIIIEGLVQNSNNRMAIYSPNLYIGNAVTQWKFNKPDNSDRTLYSADTLPGVPSESNVRQGVAYGPSNNLTGSLTVPSPSNVRKGVPTDNTVGTAELTAQDLFNEIASSSDIIAQRLRNVATVDTTAATIAAYNS